MDALRYKAAWCHYAIRTHSGVGEGRAPQGGVEAEQEVEVEERMSRNGHHHHMLSAAANISAA